jgi:hypothetical protein
MIVNVDWVISSVDSGVMVAIKLQRADCVVMVVDGLKWVDSDAIVVTGSKWVTGGRGCKGKRGREE